jgi:hypothetical protein
MPWGHNRALTTLITRLRAVDSFDSELVCIDVATTPLEPSEKEGPYGEARLFLWANVALAGAYWIVVGVARIVSAWGRGATRNGRGVWGRIQSGGFILASAISGERLATSPALIRFCTFLPGFLTGISSLMTEQVRRRCGMLYFIRSGAPPWPWLPSNGLHLFVSFPSRSIISASQLIRR